MKIYTKESEGLVIRLTWNEERSNMRIESGPPEAPDELVVEYQGLSKWGMKQAIHQHFRDWIGCFQLINECLEFLGIE